MWKASWTRTITRPSFRSQYRVAQARLQHQSTAPETSISPTLLNRAKSLEAEHNLLSKQLSANYDATIAKKAGSLAPIAESYKAWETAKNVHSLPRRVYQACGS